MLVHIDEELLTSAEADKSILNSNCSIKLADFGFARKLEHGEYLNEFFGTLSYMAPEVLLKNNYDKKADIWSLGISIFELLTGKLPFNAISKKDLKFKHCLGKYKVSSSLKISYDALDFINHCI